MAAHSCCIRIEANLSAGSGVSYSGSQRFGAKNPNDLRDDRTSRLHRLLFTWWWSTCVPIFFEVNLANKFRTFFFWGRSSVGLNASWLLNFRSFWTWTFQYYRSQLNFSNFIKPFLPKPKSISDNKTYKKWYSDGSFAGFGPTFRVFLHPKIVGKKGRVSEGPTHCVDLPKSFPWICSPRIREEVWLLGCPPGR